MVGTSYRRLTYTIVSTLLLLTAISGCLGTPEKPSDKTSFTLTATGVPGSVETGKSFSFSLKIDGGPKRTSDHIGAHFGANSTTSPSTTVYDKTCAHTAGDVPGTFTVTCSIDAAGTWYLRGHLRINESGNLTNFWTSEFTVKSEGLLPIGEISVGTDAAFPPFEDFNTETGEYFGFDIDLMREVGNRSAFTPKFENLGFDPLIPALQNGQIRLAISAMSITEERSEKVDFSIPYYEANQSVMVRTGDEATYKSLDDMKDKGLKFGVQTGTVGADLAVEHFGEESTVRYDTYPLAVEALKRGDVDAVIMDAPAQKEQAKRDSTVTVAFEFSVGDVYGIAMKKGDSVMRTRINAALTTIYADGTMERLREKWGLQ